MKRIALVIVLAAATVMNAGAMKRRDTLTPPPAPVVTNAIPAMPEWARLDAGVRLTHGTGILAPFIGASARGVLTIGQNGQTVSGRLVEARDPVGNELDAGNLSFDSFPVYASGPYITGRTERSWGYADVRATRMDESNVVLQAWGDAQGSHFIVTGTGVLVAIDAPVVVPPAPPANTNIPTAAEWTRKTIESYSADYKVKSIIPVPRGFVASTYNKNSRRDAFLDEFVKDVRKNIYKGTEETLGQEFEAALSGDYVYFQAEVGKNVLRYETKSGKVSKGIALASHQEFNVENTRHAGTVVFGACGKNGDRTAIYDAVNGRKLWDSPLKGLVSSLSSDGPTLWWAVSGEGICNSSGQSWKAKAASVAVWRGVPHYGSLVDGAIYALDGGAWVKVLDAKASKINRMVESSDGALLVAAANPDTFWRVLPSYTVEVLARFTDQAQAVSGEAFDAYIVQETTTTILASRAKPAGAEIYRFTRKGPEPAPESTPTPAPAPVMPSDLAGAGQSGFRWKPDAEGGGGGLVVLFNAKLVPFVKSATINGKDSRQQVPPYKDGRGAIRWSGKKFSGALTLALNLSDGRKLVYAIPNGLANYDNQKDAVKIRPAVVNP